MKPNVTVGKIQKNLVNYGNAIAEQARQILDVNFIEGANMAKEKAPWTDRTGDARRSIATADLSSNKMLSFWLYIGVEYGIWLELSNQGKYRILTPVFSVMERNIERDFQKAGFKLQ